MNTTPTMVLNYNNAVIYNIACLDKSLGDTYIGSTTNFKKTLHSLKLNVKNQTLNPNYIILLTVTVV